MPYSLELYLQAFRAWWAGDKKHQRYGLCSSLVTSLDHCDWNELHVGKLDPGKVNQKQIPTGSKNQSKWLLGMEGITGEPQTSSVAYLSPHW